MQFLVGKRGNTIRKVAEDVEQGLKQFYLNDVRVKLFIKHSKDDSEYNSAKSLTEVDKETSRRLS